MDDLINGHLEESGLASWVTIIVELLQQHGLKIVPKENTISTPISYIVIPLNTHSSQIEWTPINPALTSYFIRVTKDTGENEVSKALVANGD